MLSIQVLGPWLLRIVGGVLFLKTLVCKEFGKRARNITQSEDVMSLKEGDFFVGRILANKSFDKTAMVRINPNQGGQFIFVLGLEGTGHHMCRAIWDRCDRCVDIRGIRNLIYNQNGNRGIFLELDAKTFKKTNELLVQKLSGASKKNMGNLIIMNTWEPGKNAAGMLSYPNFMGTNRFIHHPHASHLFHEAKKARVVVKFLVLVRSGEQMIISTTVKRKFAGKEQQVKTFENMCQEMRYTLMEIGTENYGCIDYNKITPESLNHTGTILGFDGNSFKNTVLSIFHQSHPHPSSFSHADSDFMKPLTDCVEQLKLLCGTR